MPFGGQCLAMGPPCPMAGWLYARYFTQVPVDSSQAVSQISSSELTEYKVPGSSFLHVSVMEFEGVVGGRDAGL